MKQKLKDNAETIVAILVIIAMTVGGIAFFAKASDLQLVEQRLDQKIKSDKIYQLKQQLWLLWKQHKTKNCLKMPEPDDAICQGIVNELEQLSKNVKI